VGKLTAMRLAQEGLGNILLVDIIKGLAQGQALDLEDAQPFLKYSYHIEGTEDIQKIKDSDIVIITAGLARKPGMSREDLLHKNALILGDISRHIKKLSPNAVVIVVTNPVDIMTYYVLKVTALRAARVLGMGISLDTARFTNLISKELNIPLTDISACVIGSHGEGMLPLSRLTTIKGINLEEFLPEQKIQDLVKKTINRGTEIVALLGSGSAYFAPSAAINEIVRAMAKDEKRILGISAYSNGEYGLRDVCIGVPCRLGKSGIEQIIELDLNTQEKEAFLKSARDLKEQLKNLPI